MSILNSTITWEILEEDFRKAFSSQATLGPNRQCKAIGEGEGFLSKIALIDFDWVNDSTEKMPPRAVIKICIIENSGTTVGNDLTAEMNDNELNIYAATKEEDIAIFGHIQKPKFYCGRHYGTGTGYIAIEYVSGTITRMPWQDLNDDVIREALRIIASLAVKSLKKPELAQKWNSHGYNAILEDLCQLETMEKRLKNFGEKYPEEERNVDYMLTKTEELFGSYEKFKERSHSTTRKLVFCHGDMWAPNLMHRICKETGKAELVAVIDWQLQHIGSPCEDLMFLIFSGTNPDNYLKMYVIYLRYFWDILSESLTKEEMLWQSCDQLIEQFERTYAVFILMMIGWMAEAKNELLKSTNHCPNESKLFDRKIVFMSQEVTRCLKKWFP